MNGQGLKSRAGPPVKGTKSYCHSQPHLPQVAPSWAQTCRPLSSRLTIADLVELPAAPPPLANPTRVHPTPSSRPHLATAQPHADQGTSQLGFLKLVFVPQACID